MGNVFIRVVPVSSCCHLCRDTDTGNRVANQWADYYKLLFFFQIIFFYTLFQGPKYSCIRNAPILKCSTSPKPSLLFVVHIQYWNNLLYPNIYMKSGENQATDEGN